MKMQRTTTTTALLIPGQSADIMALVKNRLLRCVRFGNLILAVVGVPEQFGALETSE